MYMCIRTLLLDNYIYLFLQIQCKNRYARHRQQSYSYPHEDITLQLNYMIFFFKKATRCNRDSFFLTSLFNSLVTFLSSLFGVCQHVDSESDLKCISNKKGEAYSCQMALRGNASPWRGHLVTPNQPKLLAPEILTKCFHMIERRTKITDASPAVMQDSRLIKVSN